VIHVQRLAEPIGQLAVRRRVPCLLENDDVGRECSECGQRVPEALLLIDEIGIAVEHVQVDHPEAIGRFGGRHHARLDGDGAFLDGEQAVQEPAAGGE
jgi:hypothetical protein